MPDYDKISNHHKDQLLKVLTHYMDQTLRNKLATECPAAYNALCGRETVHVRTSENKVLYPDAEWADCTKCGTPIYYRGVFKYPTCTNCLPSEPEETKAIDYGEYDPT